MASLLPLVRAVQGDDQVSLGEFGTLLTEAFGVPSNWYANVSVEQLVSVLRNRINPASWSISEDDRGWHVSIEYPAQNFQDVSANTIKQAFVKCMVLALANDGLER